MTLTEAVEHFHARKDGKEYSAYCPVHENPATSKTPSLGIAEKNGRIVLVCRTGGCSRESIVAAVGLKMSDLFVEPRSSNGHKPQLVDTYLYMDNCGSVRYAIDRYIPKTFKARRPDPARSGQWIHDMKGVTLLPYRLPELIPAEMALLCDGEKDCNAAYRLGVPATCNAFGQAKWNASYVPYLRGKHCVVVTDVKPGPGKAEEERTIAKMVAASLVGTARSVKRIELPQAKDLSEWIEHGGTKEQLEDLIAATPLFTPDAGTPPPPPPPAPKADSFEKEATLISFATVAKEHLKYLWDKYLPFGKLIHVAGDSGEGKSPLLLDLIARITTGADWPDGTKNIWGPRSVILCAGEDDPNDTIVPRLELAGADLAKVFFVRITVRVGQNRTDTQLALDRDLQELMVQMAQVSDLAAVVIDPITNYLGKVQMRMEEEVRSQLLMPLVATARFLGIVVVTIGHLNRLRERHIPLQRIMGAAAFHGVARFIYFAGGDPDDEDKHAHVLVQKRGVNAPSLRYRTMAKPMTWPNPDGVDETSEVVGIEWRGTSTATAEDTVDPKRQSEKSEEAQAAAELLKLVREDLKVVVADAKEALTALGYKLVGDPPLLNWSRIMSKAGVKSMRFPGEHFYSCYLPAAKGQKL